MTTGVVTTWLDEEGWGTVTAPELDGPVFVHFGAIRDQPGYRSLAVGQTVSFSWERADQDGCRYCAVAVLSGTGAPPAEPPASSAPAYTSSLEIEFDQRWEPLGRLLRAADDL